jgi:nitrate reductase molybdenum cofactor assembly chaperone NarJ/NarW
MMTRTFKVMAALLCYPDQSIQDSVPDFQSVLADEGIVPKRQRARLSQLIDELATRNLYDLQERYVQLFDRSRALSLHLFEHVHGESRDRGQAMVDLQMLYAKHGLDISAKELPDFLPLFLEFLSTRPIDEARAMLGEPRHVLEALLDRLQKRKSIYASVFQALISVAADNAAAEIGDIQTQDDDPDDLEALDRIWEEEPVVFGGGEKSCPIADNMVAKLKVPESPQPRPRGQGVRA